MPISKLPRAALATCLGLILAAPPLAAQHGLPRGATRPARSAAEEKAALSEKLQALLSADAPSLEEMKDFLTGVTRAAWNDESLPSVGEDPEAYYGPEHLAYRQTWYGPLRDDPTTRELLRRLASGRAEGGSIGPRAGFSMSRVTAALCLADRPDTTDLQAILAGYEGLAPTSRQVTSYARQIGRAVARLEPGGSMETSPVVADALAVLRRDASGGPAARRGAAIEGLLRAGHADDALPHLEEMLETQTTDAARVLPVLQACRRCFRLPGIDPGLEQRAVALACAAARKALESAPSRRAVGISPEARALRAAVGFLRSVANTDSVDLLMDCCGTPRAIELLGMDGLQDLRMSLQRLRGRGDAKRKERLDRLWHDLLIEAAERLFVLAEEPMDIAERRAFFAARDLRYNAAAYFCDLWQRDDDVRTVWADDPEAMSLLECFVEADKDEFDGEETNRLYYAVREKLEIRVLVTQLIAYMERDLDFKPSIDLFGTLATILGNEVGSAESIKARLAMSVLGGRRPEEFTIPIRREPSDGYVRDRAAAALKTLGWRVQQEGAKESREKVLHLTFGVPETKPGGAAERIDRTPFL